MPTTDSPSFLAAWGRKLLTHSSDYLTCSKTTSRKESGLPTTSLRSYREEMLSLLSLTVPQCSYLVATAMTNNLCLKTECSSMLTPGKSLQQLTQVNKVFNATKTSTAWPNMGRSLRSARRATPFFTWLSSRWRRAQWIGSETLAVCTERANQKSQIMALENDNQFNLLY